MKYSWNLFPSCFTGLPNVDEDSPEAELDALLKAADIFYLPRLGEIITNIQNSEEFLNPSIGTYLNDLTGHRSKEMFFNKPVFSDVQFEVEGRCYSILAYQDANPIAISKDN